MGLKKPAKKFAKKLMIFLYRIMVKILPVDEKLVVFGASLGKNYSGNPKAIYDELVTNEKYSDYRPVWYFNKEYLNKESALIPSRCKVVTYGRLAYYYYMARAHYWVFDCRQEDYLIKRDGVKYLQTWHGTPLKKLGLDIEEVYMAQEGDTEEYKEKTRKNAKTWDYLIAQNSFSEETFRRCFDFNGEILRTGYPRNDCLVKAAKKDLQREITIYKEGLGIPKEKKVILYAPTWRDDEHLENGWYKFVTKMDFDRMYEALGEEYILVVKSHYLVKYKQGDFPKRLLDNGFIKTYDNDVDISRLYIVSDLMITDYSSVMFDYANLGKRMIFYVFDLERYKNVLRGFYFDLLLQAPGPVVSDTEELIGEIKAADETYSEKYGNKYLEFKKKYTEFDEGDASKKALGALIK